MIKQEIQKGVIPDPNAPVDPATGLPTSQPPNSDSINGDSGQIPIDPQSPTLNA